MSAASSPKALLERYGLSPKHSFGQNLLADAHLAERIALACEARGGSVAELGAGLDARTRQRLASRPPFVLAVERDRDVVAPLAEEFAEHVTAGQLQISETDAKTVDFASVLSGRPKPHVVAGNLPYQIAGP